MNSLDLFLLGFPSGSEWLIILLVVLLLFGGRKIPELMRGIGRGIREFHRARHALEEEIREGMREADEEKDESATSGKKESASTTAPVKGGGGT